MSFRGFNNLNIIDRSILTLFQSLTPKGVRRFKDVIIIRELYLLPWSDPVKETQQIARSILRFFGVKNSAVKVLFDPALLMPGRVKLGVSDVFFVDIHATYKHQRDVVIAILAHEITHIFLHKHQIIFESTAENEILTDTTATFFGFGPSILNVAYSKTTITENSETTSKYKLGYLTVDEFGYIIAKRDRYFRAAAPIQIKSGLPAEGHASGRRLIEQIGSQRPFAKRDIFDRLCWWVKSLFVQNPAPDNMPIVFKCQHCSQMLRIPASRKTLQVKCSTCEAVQVCYS